MLRKGETIGWSTKYNKLRPKSFGLLSATVGTLAQQMRTLTDEEISAKYKIILIDETHERDLETDMTIYMLKNFLLRNVNKESCPFVVLMSATFDPDSFLRYFNVQLLTNYIWCRGATAHIEEMWDWNQDRTVNNYTQSASAVVEKIVNDNKNPIAMTILPVIPPIPTPIIPVMGGRRRPTTIIHMKKSKYGRTAFHPSSIAFRTSPPG